MNSSPGTTPDDLCADAQERSPRARPILFSGPMVRALLAGTKTQTRRIVKGVPSGDHYGRDIMDWGLSGIHQGDFDELAGTDRWFLDVQTDVDDNSRREIRCPYGAPGDRLWVRETLKRAPNLWTYAADAAEVGWPARQRLASLPRDYVPSIHMPRIVSRLTLEITEVRVERLQDISAADADAECFGGDFPENVLPEVFPRRDGGWGHLSLPECYGRLWEHINGPGSWADNPWVWAVSFEVARATGPASPQGNSGRAPKPQDLSARDQ